MSKNLIFHLKFAFYDNDALFLGIGAQNLIAFKNNFSSYKFYSLYQFQTHSSLFFYLKDKNITKITRNNLFYSIL